MSRCELVWRMSLLATVGLVGCGPPDICGTVEIRAVTPETMQFDTDGDGDLDLVELCGTDYGAFAAQRPDYKMTIVTLDWNTPSDDLSDEGLIEDVHLPAAQIVFLDKHLVPGEHLTMANIAGNGLHKQNAADTYIVYPLTSGTIDIIGGPYNHEDETVIDSMHFSEEWQLQWDLVFGGGVEHWTGTDRIKRTDGNDIGTPVVVPPDYGQP